MTHINNLLNRVESLFNFAECTPILCIYSGILRTIAGKVQQVVGCILAVIGTIGSFIAPRSSTNWSDVCEWGLSHITHGALNVLRGFSTTLLAVNTCGGLGNVLLLIPNLEQNPPFSPTFTYDLGLDEMLKT